MPRIGSPAAAIRAGIVSSVNASGSTPRDLLPLQRRRDARVGRRPHRVRRRDRTVARVLAEVDEHADAIGDAPRRGRDPLVTDPPLDLLGDRLGEAAHVREEHSGLIGARMCRPVAPDVFGYERSPSSSSTVAHDERDLAHERPLPVAVGSRSISR